MYQCARDNSGYLGRTITESKWDSTDFWVPTLGPVVGRTLSPGFVCPIVARPSFHKRFRSPYALPSLTASLHTFQEKVTHSQFKRANPLCFVSTHDTVTRPFLTLLSHKYHFTVWFFLNHFKFRSYNLLSQTKNYGTVINEINKKISIGERRYLKFLKVLYDKYELGML